MAGDVSRSVVPESILSVHRGKYMESRGTCDRRRDEYWRESGVLARWAPRTKTDWGQPPTLRLRDREGSRSAWVWRVRSRKTPPAQSHQPPRSAES
jgi:hypothetical protein